MDASTYISWVWSDCSHIENNILTYSLFCNYFSIGFKSISPVTSAKFNESSESISSGKSLNFVSTFYRHYLLNCMFNNCSHYSHVFKGGFPFRELVTGNPPSVNSPSPSPCWLVPLPGNRAIWILPGVFPPNSFSNIKLNKDC